MRIVKNSKEKQITGKDVIRQNAIHNRNKKERAISRRNQVPYGKVVRRGIVGVEAEDALEFAICRHLLHRSHEHPFVYDRLLDY
jgi:hypothetical protein